MKFLFLSIALGMFLPTLSFAKGAGHCHRELKNLCKDKASGKEKFDCMRENLDKLSPDCKQIMEDKKENVGEMISACKEDRKKCEGVQPGGGRIYKCLKGKINELSPACKAKIEKGQKEDFESKED